jgi:hypothetical protein
MRASELRPVVRRWTAQRVWQRGSRWWGDGIARPGGHLNPTQETGEQAVARDHLKGESPRFSFFVVPVGMGF